MWGSTRVHSGTFTLIYANDMPQAIKCYLHYKTAAFQNMPSEIQVQNFLFCRKVMFRSQDFHVFVFLTIP